MANPIEAAIGKEAITIAAETAAGSEALNAGARLLQDSGLLPAAKKVEQVLGVSGDAAALEKPYSAERLASFDVATDTTFPVRKPAVWESFAGKQENKALLHRVNILATGTNEALEQGRPINTEFLTALNKRADSLLGPVDRQSKEYVEDLVMTIAKPKIAASFREGLSETVPGFKKYSYDNPVIRDEMIDFDNSFTPGGGQLNALRERFPEIGPAPRDTSFDR